MANELEGGTTMETKKGSDASSQMCCTTSFKCLKNIHLKCLPPNTTSLVQPMNTRILKKSEDAVSRKVRKLHPRSK
jgi:hypothetical protein